MGWKQMTVQGHISNLWINEKGRVKNRKTGNYISPFTTNYKKPENKTQIHLRFGAHAETATIRHLIVKYFGRPKEFWEKHRRLYYDGISYENYYITNDGKLYSIFSEKYNKIQTMEKTGYNCYRICKSTDRNLKTEYKTCYAHIMVAESWIGMKPTPDHEVNHMDYDKQNNHYTNLEWITRRANMKHSWLGRTNRLDFITEPILQTFFRITTFREVVATSKLETLKFLNTYKAQEKFTHLTTAAISCRCSAEYHTGGYQWKWGKTTQMQAFRKTIIPSVKEYYANPCEKTMEPLLELHGSIYRKQAIKYALEQVNSFEELKDFVLANPEIRIKNNIHFLL